MTIHHCVTTATLADTLDPRPLMDEVARGLNVAPRLAAFRLSNERRTWAKLRRIESAARGPLPAPGAARDLPSAGAIERAVAEAFDVPPMALRSRSRKPAATWARAVAAYLLAKLRGMSGPETAAHFGLASASKHSDARRRVARELARPAPKQWHHRGVPLADVVENLFRDA